MALLNWLDDGSNNDQQDNQPTPAPAIKQVASVQSTWQPTQTSASSTDSSSTGTTPDNYLMSDQHAQADSEVAAQRAAEEAARQQAAAAAEANRQANAAAAAAQQTTQTQEVTPAQPKYSGGQKKNEGGFTGFLKDIGSGFQQGIGALGDIAAEGGGVLDYAGRRIMGQNDANAAVAATQNTERVRNWLHGQQDINGNKFVGTQDVDQAGANIAAGRGTAQDFAAVGGKGLQAGIDATQFLNPAKMAFSALPEVERSASMLSHLTPVVQNAARDAAFYGGTQGVATTAQQYGQNGDIIKALEDGGKDALIGGALQGGLDLSGHALGAGVRQGVKTLTPVAQSILSRIHPGELAPAIDHAGEMVNDGLHTAEQRLNSAEEKPGQNDQNQPQDGNVAFSQPGTLQPDGSRKITLDGIAPIADHYNAPASPTPVADGLSSLSHDPTTTPASDAPMPLNELSQRATMPDPSAQLTPEATPVPVKEPAATSAPSQVADGTVQPSQAMPATDPNMPVIKPEQVKALQDAKAGASQANESALNQQLQQAHNETPAIHDPHTPEGIAGIAPHDDAETSLDKIDKALESGQITPDEHAAIENHIFDQENQAGRMMAEDGSSLPDGMNTDKPTGDVTPADVAANSKPLVPRGDISDRFMSVNDDSGKLKQQLATAVGMANDGKLDVPELLNNSKLSDGAKARTEKYFKRLDEVSAKMNDIQNTQKKGFTSNGVDGLSTDLGKEHSTLQAEKGLLQAKINSYIRKADGQSSFGSRIANAVENITGARNASLLESVGGIERNLAQDTMANVVETLKNPGKMISGLLTTNAAKSAVKEVARGWMVAPKTVSESLPYLMGNTYRSLMTLTTAMANVRTNTGRRANAELALRMAGEPVTHDAISKMVSAGGSDSELIANTMAGVANGMTSSLTSKRVTDAYTSFLRTGSEADKAAYMANVEKATSLARKMSDAAIASHDPLKRTAGALINVILPFVSTPANLAITAVHQIANPMGRSVTDQLLKDVRTNPQNIAALIKDKAVDYGMVAAVGALVSANVIGYNDGEDPSKPQGIYIHTGGDTYVSARSTSIELPIAAVVATMKMVQDAASGNERPPAYYLGIVGHSLPYVDSSSNILAAAGSAVGEYLNGDGTSGTGDNGYAAKAYGVNLAKSFVPFSNNGVQPAMDGLNGKSTDAKSTYAFKPVIQKDGTTKNVADLPTWFGNTVKSSYGDVIPGSAAFRNGLPTSRDAAGRARTSDSQGLIINKHINDANTANYNDTINKLVDYGRQNGLGSGTADMFNGFNQGKNNNFRSAQGAISFLDVPQGSSPSNADKLKANPKLTDLSKQIHDGFFGDSGSNLLTLDGKDLKSDASVPGTSGAKNSNLPMSMQSIKNAIAQTDLPKTATDQLYQFSQQKTDLYNQLHNKQINYDQYSAAKSQIDQQEGSILTASPAYQKFDGLMQHLNDSGFFNDGGLGSTKSGQTFLWNSLNTMLGDKGATPAAQYPTTSSFKPFNFNSGTGRTANAGGKNPGQDGVKWTPVTAGKMASVSAGKYTPVNIKVNLGNAVKKDKTQNYASTSF